jgi:glutamyl-tRNA reductase
LSIAVVGINHRTVPLEALEPLIVAPEDLSKALSDLCDRPYLDEVVVLSTCMRTEIYAVVSRFHGAMADIREFLVTWSGKAPEEFSGSLYSYFDEAAVNHLFRVAAGLDSASLGENEVLGQVRHAYEVARREGAVGTVLGAAFRDALRVGKRARTETTISRGTTSLSYAAVALSERALGGLAGKQPLVIGLGEIGEAAARAFSDAEGAHPVMLANRTRAKTEKLAGALGGSVVAWEALSLALSQADVVVSCTGARHALLSAESLAGAASRRPERTLVVVDLGVPRSVEPTVRDVAGVQLLDMDDLKAFVAARVGERWAEVPAVERIVAEELAHYGSVQAARTVAPLVSRLHDWAEEVRRAELSRLDGRLSSLGPTEREAVELVTRRVVAKILHEPTVNLKAAAGTPRGEAMAEAFRELFGLGSGRGWAPRLGEEPAGGGPGGPRDAGHR